MKKYMLITLGIVGLLFSCKKNQSPKQFSYWYVNSDSFASNNVTKGGYSDGMRDIHCVILKCNNSSDFFEFYFDHTNYLPNNGTYYLTDSLSYNPSITDRVKPSFGYNGKLYIVPPNSGGFLYATQVNYKSVFRMDSTTFYYINDANDSVVIHGVFSQP